MTTGSPPVINYGTWQYLTWYPGLSFSADLGAGNFTDPQGQTLTYSASLSDGTALPSWLSFDAATGTLSGTVPSSYQSVSSTEFDLTVTATDSAGLSAGAGVDLHVNKALPPSQSNFAPTVHVLPGASFTARMPADIFSDPQNLPMTYSAVDGDGTSPLPSWITFDPATLTFSGTAPANAVANHPVQLHATDSAGQTGSVWFTLYFTAGPPNLSQPTADQSWTVGQAVDFTLPAGTFTDPQGQALTYSLTGANGQEIPSWLTFNAKTLAFTGTPPNSEAGLSLGLQVTATDSGNLSSSETFTVAFTSVPAPTLSTPTPAQSWGLDQAVSFTLPAGTFTDISALAPTYTAKSADGSALPSWLAFDPATRTFSGTTPGISATLSLEVDATNYAGATTGDVFTVTIGQPNAKASPPDLTDPMTYQAWTAGQPVSLTLPADSFTDPQGLALTYSASLAAGEGALPSWLSFDAATRTFSGIVPSAGADLGIQVTATDSAGAYATETFAVLGSAQSSGTVQSVTAIPDQTFKVGQAISIALPTGAFTDPQGLALTYSASLTDGAALPSWLSVNPSSGTITGTAPFTGESLSVRLTAADSSGAYTGHDDFLLNVPAPYAPELKDSVHDQAWTLGQAVSLVLPADSFLDPGGEALTYTAALSNGGALPSWLRFDAASQTFSGTVPGNAASLTVTVTATDSGGLTGTETFGIAVSGSAPSVGDSAAYVGANLDALQASLAAGKISSIYLTDGGTPTLSLTSAEVSGDAQALAAISNSFSVAQTASGSNLTITGVANATGNTVVFSGKASQYAIASAGDGVHLTVGTDQVSGVQALQFADVTDIVAQAPGSGASVTSGNVTELYGAVMGREPDVAGLAFYQGYAAANPGTPLLQFAEWFLSSSEYTSTHSYAQTAAGDTRFIEDSYQSLLHRAPTQDEVTFYLTKVLDQPGSQLQTHAQMLVYFSASSEFLGNVEVTAQNPSSASHWLILL